MVPVTAGGRSQEGDLTAPAAAAKFLRRHALAGTLLVAGSSGSGRDRGEPRPPRIHARLWRDLARHASGEGHAQLARGPSIGLPVAFDHPGYRERTALGEETRASLLADLLG